MSILFVTSFSPDLYEASGRELLASFLAVKQPGDLLVCQEGRRNADALNGNFIRYWDMDADPYLHTWLRLNADAIPDYLGGQAKECQCPDREKRHAKHKFGCHWQWMNRNASRWFRKIVALRYAFTHLPRYGNPRYVVWLDADVVFKKALSEQYLAQKLQGNAFFYFRGHRPAVEAGIMGFDTRARGDDFFFAVAKRYDTRAYLKDERWDDGFQWAVVIDQGKHKTRDLVHPRKWKNKTNDVIPTTDIAEYLEHRKGRHGTGLGIMK